MTSNPQKRVTTFATIVGAVLLALRFRSRQRQSDLAAAAGVTQPSWSRVERGEGDLTIDQLVTLGHALHLPSGFVLHVAEDVAKRVAQNGITVEWHRWDVEHAGAAVGFVGVADLAEDVQRVMGWKAHKALLEKRPVRMISAVARDHRGTVADALDAARHLDTGIGRRVRRKSTRR